MATMRSTRAITTIGIIAVMAAALAARLWFVFAREFDNDELSTIHAAWNLSRGLVIYRDFFEHHTPWVYYLLAPLIGQFATATDPSSGPRAMFACRLVMWVAAISIVGLVWRIGTRWRGGRTGMLAAAITATSPLFADLTLEVRPDVPALLCFVASIAALFEADRATTRAGTGWLAVTGVALGAATMFLQKYVIVVPVMMLAAAISAGTPAAPRERWRRAAVVVGGAMLPIAATIVWFWRHDALDAFTYYNATFNATLHRAPFGPLRRLPGITLRNPVLVLIGLTGAIVVARANGRSHADRMLLLIGAGAVVLLAAMPVPYSQHYIPLVPLLALFTAGVLADRAGALAVFALAVYSAIVLRVTFVPAAPQLDDLRYVMTHTAPGEAVLDGFTGYGIFRPDAWFFCFVNWLTRSPQIERELADGLEAGRITPAIVLFDGTLSDFPERVTSFIRARYTPVRGVIWARREVRITPIAPATSTATSALRATTSSTASRTPSVTRP
jgi:4-amino-4-deoxy-L-arabinose transferase-like glycosyltransferase